MNLFGGALSNAVSPAQQSVHAPARSQCFLSALLRPLSDSPSRIQGGWAGGGLDGRQPVTAASLCSGSCRPFGRSQSPTKAFPTSTPTTTTLPTTHGSGAAAASPAPSHQPQNDYLGAPPLFIGRGGGNIGPEGHTFLSRFSFIWSPHDGGAGSCDYVNGCSTASGAESLPPSRQGPGDMLQLSRFTGTSPPAAASPSPVSLFHGRHPHSEVSPLNPTPQQRPGPFADDHAQAPVPMPPSTKPGLRAPQMLCYRQCLEVNPDLKSNCTWALDRYMQCQEDSQL
ncbi:hypothetical protein JIQ42_07195 [Leishmania sp. Namibia]|uniref:hypothetical protein n=1 Tax=Leishmania sp. Namibia TaxID=2802991 RepID=UPI001B4FA88A|nr:hypothetical protein JIQ42_07195 [Leishmania sp. Namibia]